MNKWEHFTEDELIEIEFSMTHLKRHYKYSVPTHNELLDEIRKEFVRRGYVELTGK